MEDMNIRFGLAVILYLVSITISAIIIVSLGIDFPNDTMLINTSAKVDGIFINLLYIVFCKM